jgi:hypothetical protein
LGQDSPKWGRKTKPTSRVTLPGHALCMSHHGKRHELPSSGAWTVWTEDRGPYMQDAKPLPTLRVWARQFCFLHTAYCLPATGNCPGRVHRWTFAEISSKNCNFPQLFGTPGEACRWHGSIRKSRHAKQIWPDTRFPGRSRSLVAGPPPKLQYQIPLIVHYLRRLSVDRRKRRARESRNQNPGLSCDRAE